VRVGDGESFSRVTCFELEGKEKGDMAPLHGSYTKISAVACSYTKINSVHVT